MRPDPLCDLLRRQGLVILDGGLATALEARGHDLDDELWSARLLLDAPEEIIAVHRKYLEAGADCIITASYQAAFENLRRYGLNDAGIERLLRRSTNLAVEARDSFRADPHNRPDRVLPLIAASIGPYGAVLADGSEYTGNYSVDDAALHHFHERRWTVLSDTPADLLACETLPSFRELRVLLHLLRETSGKTAWFSFSCRDGARIADGTPIEEAAGACGETPGVAAVGVNCTAPRHVLSLIERIRRTTDLPIVVYPNSGETWDAARRRWVPEGGHDWLQSAVAWADAGATIIGGCCRVGPDTISALRRRLLPRRTTPAS